MALQLAEPFLRVRKRFDDLIDVVDELADLPVIARINGGELIHDLLIALVVQVKLLPELRVVENLFFEHAPALRRDVHFLRAGLPWEVEQNLPHVEDERVHSLGLLRLKQLCDEQDDVEKYRENKCAREGRAEHGLRVFIFLDGEDHRYDVEREQDDDHRQSENACQLVFFHHMSFQKRLTVPSL